MHPQDKTILEMLVEHVVGCLMGKRTYSREQVEIVARVGSCRSAGCAMSALADIIFRVSAMECV